MKVCAGAEIEYCINFLTKNPPSPSLPRYKSEINFNCMNCPKCDAELIEDDGEDSSVISSNSCEYNFMCENCNSHFIIEYSAIDVREI